MRPAALLLALLLGPPTPLLHTGPAQAQHRRHHRRPRRPAAPPGTASPVATVVRTERASARDAREALLPHLPAIARCVADARATDPIPIATLHAVGVVIRLTPRGTADSVEIAPSGLSRGLSACLATTLLAWRQGGHPPPRASVLLRVALDPPP